MNSRSIVLLAACAAIAACNSKSSAPAQDAVENTGLATGNGVSTDVSVSMAPAPAGLPSRIANDAVKASGQKCDAISAAERDPQDGTITATCSGGERYRVYTAEGKGAVATSL